MADDEPTKIIPDWLAALRHPTEGDVRLSPYVKAPEHIPDILKPIAVRRLADRRRIVRQIDWMAIRYSWAMQFGKSKHPPKFKEIKSQLESHARTAANFLEEKKQLDAALGELAIYRAAIGTTRKSIEWYQFDPSPQMKNYLTGLRAMLDADVYHAAFHQTAHGKSLERGMLWEPLFRLLNSCGRRVRDFKPLTMTVKKLHLAIGADPPDMNAFGVAKSDWVKREKLKAGR